MSLKSKRIESGITQKEAADMFGIKYRTYQNYENGVTSPDMDTAAKFARYFSCTIGDLFDLEEGQKDRLDQKEEELLEIFRRLTDEGKSALIAAAQGIEGAFSLGSGIAEVMGK